MECYGRSSRRLAVLCAAALLLSACRGGPGSGSAVPAPGPTGTMVGVLPNTQPTVAPSPSGSPLGNSSAFVCPASDSVAAARRPQSSAGEGARMPPRRSGSQAPAAAASQLVGVTYDTRTAAAHRPALAAREAALQAKLTREYSFNYAHLATQILTVPAAQVTAVEAALRQSLGVRQVGLTGTRRYATRVAQPYFPNDPYFTGFSTTVAPVAGATAPPATFMVGPLEENASVPGQWDMHATRLEYAFGYSQASNGSGITNPAALGSSAVKIAVIDTGEDTTQPELASKVVYQRCFITSPSNVQSMSTFTTDQDGHGTDVAGIAGADTNNGLGFTGAGGNVRLYAYRVFPTPDDNCTKTKATDDQCGTNTQDIASAINDAVNSRVNVINLSLGGTACNTDGSDSDPVEGAAVANAIAANVIVVAAAGNAAGPPVEAPACDPGVIAVGATALADGAANGSSKTGGSSAAPFEYVAAYTDYGTPGAAPGASSAWGIVAPGGDPTNGNDADDLHWIENIWTSTPFDQNFAGNCGSDYAHASGAADCRILIAGTSMATPHVAGAAALILSVNPSYQSPALMKQLLCATAADIADPNEGCGRLDVYRAMATALGDRPIPPMSPTP